MRVRSLSWEDTLKKEEIATHSSILAWRIPRTEEPSGLQSVGLQRVRQDLATKQQVQFSRSVVSDSLQPYESQHARPPCPSPTPGVHSNSCPSSRWCHPTISCSVVPLSSCPQSLPKSGSFPMSQCFTWGGQSTGVSGNGTPLQYSCLEIPWTEEPGRLQSMGSLRVGHEWSDLA